MTSPERQHIRRTDARFCHSLPVCVHASPLSGSEESAANTPHCGLQPNANTSDAQKAEARLHPHSVAGDDLPVFAGLIPLQMLNRLATCRRTNECLCSIQTQVREVFI